MIKFPKIMVHYKDTHGTSDEWCSKCDHWLGKRRCETVSGDISPHGWCNRYKEEE